MRRIKSNPTFNSSLSIYPQPVTLKNSTQTILESYNIDYLYHMTSVDNVVSILSHGLLSHHEAHRKGLIKNDISDSEVQRRREYKFIHYKSTYYKQLHNYVPLYFNPRNPMLYCRKDVQAKIVILGIQPLVIAEPNSFFSDGNAACDSTQFYQGVGMLDKLNWDMISARYWNNLPDGKRIICSEVLVDNKISVTKIMKIFCYSAEMVERVKSFIPSNLFIKVEVNKNLYF